MMHPLVFRATLVTLASLSTMAVACSGTIDSDESVASGSSALTPAAVHEGDAGDGDAGLVCSGPLPQICELCPDRTRACAHWGVVDGQCEVEICPSHSKPIDCQGTIPGVCIVCSDGHASCAHWAFVDGECKLEICPPGTTPLEAPVQVP